jgi:RNA polymerase sigma-70 factor (ECF subfamily)
MTDEQLVHDVRRGDRAAFGLLFERHRQAIWAFFRRRVADAARAEELTQDVFVALLQNASRYEGRGAFRSYLFGIAYNLLLSDRRKEMHVATEPAEEALAAAGADLDAALWVRAALASLEPEVREIVMLREYEQLSYQEIAGLLDVPLNTVRSRLFRARMDLRRALCPGDSPEPADASLAVAPVTSRTNDRQQASPTKVRHDGR